MVDVTMPLSYFCSSLGLCFLAWNPFLPILAELAVIVAVTREITQQMVLSRLGAAMWTMVVMRLYRDDPPLTNSWMSIIMQSLVYFNVRLGAVTALYSLKNYIYPIPAYTVLNLIMSYPFLFEPGRKKWQAFLCITLGYNFLFGVLKAFHGAKFILEMELILLIAPPLALMVYKDVFK